MKAILILDEMPKHCVMCRFRVPLGKFGEHDICLINLHKFVIQSDDSCPLKPMPQRKERHNKVYNIGGYGDPYSDGWNDCLEELKK